MTPAASTVPGVHREARRLPSGATLVAEVRADAASAAAGWFVPVGSRDEPAELAGVSHALEHLAFKGTEDLDADTLNRRLDALGAGANAFTGEDRTAYYGSVLPEHLAELNDLLGAMLRPALRPADVELERRVILEEIAMAHDDPEGRATELAAAAAFAGHPLGRPILGTAASVASLSPADLHAWCAARYRPEDVVVVLTGRFDLEAEADRVDAAIRGLRAEVPGLDRSLPRSAPPFQPGSSRHGDGRLRRVYGAMLAPGVAHDDPRRVAAALLAQVLGEPGHGALHWALVDPGLADQAGLHHEPGEGFGTFVGWFETSLRHEGGVRDRFRAVLADAQSAPLDEDAWLRAQRTLATDLALQAETPIGRLMALGDAWIERGELDDPAETIARVLATPVEDGRALLEARPFDRVALVTLGPTR